MRDTPKQRRAARRFIGGLAIPVSVAGIALCALAGIASPVQAGTGADPILAQTTFYLTGLASGAANVTCAAGRRVVGGGIGTDGGTGGTLLLASGPVDETGQTANTLDGDIARGWSANLVNNGGSLRSYKVFALCSATSDARIEQTTFSLDADEKGGAFATCPAGKRATGGGIGTPEAAVDGIVQVSGPVDPTGVIRNTADGDIAKHWYASVDSPAPTRTYKVFALCSATSDATIAETRFSLAGGSSGGAFATCPTGRWATGGGIETTANTVDSSVGLSGPVDENGLVVLTSDGDLAKYWYADVHNISTARSYTVAALCAGSGLSRQAPSVPRTQPAKSVRPCAVPRLRRKRLTTATRAIRRAHCRVGKIRRRYSRRVRKGRVIAQKPRAKATRRAGTKVSLVVSRGRKSTR